MANPSIQFNLFPDAKSKAATLSYDDGTIHDRRLVEIFDRFGLKGTFHLNSGFLGHSNYLQSDEVAALFANHEVSAHSVTHPHLQNLPASQLATQILEDRRALENLVGYPVRGMSYPFGSFDGNVVNALPHLGIEYARTTQSHGGFALPDNFLRWHPTIHHRQDLSQKTADFLEAEPKGRLQLLYVWGHSHDFERDDNWEVIERFGEQISAAHEPVWLATNLEIYDYWSALQTVRVSVAGDIIHNRSALALWVSVDNEPLQLAPGEKRRL